MSEYISVKTKDGSRNVAQKPVLIARKSYYDGVYWESDTAASRLYRTESGSRYFEVFNDPNTDNDVVIPLCVQDAIQWFQDPATEQVVDFPQAFPNMVV